MKNCLLMVAAALTVSTAGAQLKTTAAHNRPARVDISKMATAREMHARDINDATIKKPLPAARSEAASPRYRRPAGMFSSVFYCKPGGSQGIQFNYYDKNAIYMMAKPYADYTWTLMPDETSGETNYAWDFWMNGDAHYVDYQPQVTFGTAFSLDTVPTLYAVNGRLDNSNAQWTPYQIKSYEWDWNTNTISAVTKARVLSAANDATATRLLFPEETDSDVTPLYSSKTMIASDASNPYLLVSYMGAAPWGENQYGWWFGKNGGYIDGIAQAFEKPEHPYQLNKVYMLAHDFVVNRAVTMNCKVYRLNEIPAYGEDDCVMLPEVPGELIATGRATVTPDFEEEAMSVVIFTLYDVENGLEVKPTIDFPILISVEGYNDEGMEDLVEFTAFMATNDQDDEGYGELAYIKWGQKDEDGNFTGEYKWAGMNNLFPDSETDYTTMETMKTGLTIFISTNNDYITYENKSEQGEYIFPSTGGVLKKTWADGSTTTGIKFLSSIEKSNWSVACASSANMPNWLTVSLSNAGGSNGEYGITANVYASPLPTGVTYREATIRFKIPGDYIDYKFMQGEKPTLFKGDVNGDNKVSIADVTELINRLLSNSAIVNEVTDVNSDGRVNISDVTTLINNLLTGTVEEITQFGNSTFTVNGVSFNMIAVEGGTFAMGATRNQGNNASSLEKPVHLVTLSDYYIGETEVTQALWLAVMGSNPSHFNDNLNNPVEMVTWNDCQTFITNLNALTGMNFRLPTEAEWEFAARGGNKSLGNMYAGSNSYDVVAWIKGNAAETTHPVATKAPNELGIYDMSGNIYEYCQDRSTTGTPAYTADPQTNPTGPESGTNCVIRGGSMDYDANLCRCAYRWSDSQSSAWRDQGLRLVLPKE